MSNLTAILPQDGSPRAIRSALTRLKLERPDADQRLAALKQQRADALLDPAADIAAVDAAVQEAETWIERLDELGPLLTKKLNEAEAAERQEVLSTACTKAETAIEAFAARLADYRRLASEIVEICQLGRQAQADAAAAQRVAEAQGYQVHLPIPGLAMLTQMVLPNPDGGLLYGKLPPPPPIIRYE